MEVRERILNNLIINERATSKQREEQFKKQQTSLNEHFDGVNTTLGNQTKALSQSVNDTTSAVNTQANAIGAKITELSQIQDVVKAYTQDIKNTISTTLCKDVEAIKTALYQPVIITDPDGKKWTLQRELPSEEQVVK